MKLFVFRPEGHGQLTFMVLAETESEAQNFVKIYIEKIIKIVNYSDGFGTNWYSTEEYGIGEVAENNND